MPYTISTNQSLATTCSDIGETMRKWGVREWELEVHSKRTTTATSLTRDERRVTLRYTRKGVPVELHSDRQLRIVDNARALYLAVERMRMIDAAGLEDIVREAYGQLPPPQDEQPVSIERSPYD